MRKLGISFLIIVGLLAALPQRVAASAPSAKNRAYFESRGDIIWEVPTRDKLIAITFDDGPDPADTPRILELLKRYEAKATFFVVGERVEKFPELVKREVKEGHEIANHTYSHQYFTKRVLTEKIEGEIRKAEDVISRVTGEKPHLFRPPGGYYGENVVNASQKSKYQVIMWSWHQDTEDWRRPGVQKIVKKVLDNARNGDIILFHDYVEGETQTVEALTQILPELKARGFTFVTVSQLLHHRLSTPVQH